MLQYEVRRLVAVKSTQSGKDSCKEKHFFKTASNPTSRTSLLIDRHLAQVIKDVLELNICTYVHQMIFFLAIHCDNSSQDNQGQKTISMSKRTIFVNTGVKLPKSQSPQENNSQT